MQEAKGVRGLDVRTPRVWRRSAPQSWTRSLASPGSPWPEPWRSSALHRGGSHKAVTITKEQRRTWSFKRRNEHIYTRRMHRDSTVQERGRGQHVPVMAVSSSKMLPCEVDSTCRILSSSSFSCRWFSADWMISLFFASCRSGRSSATTMPSNWSSSPDRRSGARNSSAHVSDGDSRRAQGRRAMTRTITRRAGHYLPVPGCGLQAVEVSVGVGVCGGDGS